MPKQSSLVGVPLTTAGGYRMLDRDRLSTALLVLMDDTSLDAQSRFANVRNDLRDDHGFEPGTAEEYTVAAERCAALGVEP